MVWWNQPSVPLHTTVSIYGIIMERQRLVHVGHHGGNTKLTYIYCMRYVGTPRVSNRWIFVKFSLARYKHTIYEHAYHLWTCMLLGALVRMLSCLAFVYWHWLQTCCVRTLYQALYPDFVLSDVNGPMSFLVCGLSVYATYCYLAWDDFKCLHDSTGLSRGALIIQGQMRDKIYGWHVKHMCVHTYT